MSDNPQNLRPSNLAAATGMLSEDLPLPQRLAMVYAPARAKQANLALFALDARLAAILRKRREPLLVQVRLAWWRDMLANPPAEWPQGDAILDLLRGWRDPSGLAALADGWEALLADELTPAIIADFAAGRAAAIACLAGELGAPRHDDVRSAAETWALADLAANIADDAERRQVVECGHTRAPALPLPASLRPLAVLAGLGRAALARGGAPLLAGPRSALLALRIGLVGR